MNLLRQTYSFAALFGAAFSATPSVSADTFVKESSESFTTVPDSRLVVEAGYGDIQLKPSDSGSIEVTVLMSVQAKTSEIADAAFERMNLSIEQSDREIRLATAKHRPKKGWFRWSRNNSAQVKISITCPPHVALDLRTSSGDIHVQGNSAHQVYETGSGSVQLENLKGEVFVETGSGDIRLNTLEGNLTAQTGSGDISAKHLKGVLDAQTGSGDIHSNGDLHRFLCRTGSGNISLHSRSSISDSAKAETGSGDITIELPADAAFAFSAATASGSIQCDFPNSSLDHTSSKSIRGFVKEASTKLSLATGSGNIQIIPN